MEDNPMARLVKPLTATQVQNAKAKEAIYKLFDGGGLFLQVNPTGGKYWKMKYSRDDGKEGLLSFGKYPDVTLEQARKKRDEARAQKAAGIDPAEAKRQAKVERAIKAQNSFETVARSWAEVHMTRVKRQTLHTYIPVLDKFIFPFIGQRPVKDLKAPDFLEVLQRIENQGRIFTAKRAAMLCSMVMSFAVARGMADSDPLPTLRYSMKTHKCKHFAAMTDPKDVARLLRSIDAYNGYFAVACALKIAPYVFVRPGELQHALWKDIDFEACEWRYTAGKTNTPHIVPLCPQVMDILKRLHHVTGHGEYLFPALWKKNKPIGATTIIAAMRGIGIGPEEMTPHGFRAMARTLLDEVLGERYDLIEHQLAHMVRDPNGRAYNRTQHLPERKRMMTRWALYLDNLRAGINEIPPFNPLETKQVEFVE
jgi:integrase